MQETKALGQENVAGQKHIQEQNTVNSTVQMEQCLELLQF